MAPAARLQAGGEGLAGSGARKVFVKSYGCQMNVYDAQRMADLLAPEGFAETAAVEDADLVILNTCHIRERAAEKVFSELGKLRDLKAERAPAGARRSSWSPAASPRPKAARSCGASARSTSSSVRRATIACRPCWRARPQPPSTRSSRSRQVRPPAAARASQVRARGVRLSHGPGRLRQVLHLLRRALHARRRIVAARRRDRGEARASCAPACARSPCSGRTSTAITARRAGAVVAWPRSAPGLRRSPASPGIRYTTSHPNDMSDDLDRGASRPAGADAVPAPAGAVGLGPHPRGDEPPAHGAAYLAQRGRDAAARPDIALSSDFIVGFPGETRGRLRRRRSRSSTRSASPAPSSSNIRRARARRRPIWPTRSTKRSSASGSRACRRWSRRSARRSTAAWSAARCRPVREARPPSRPARRQIALPAAGARRAPSRLIGRSRR